MTCKEITLFTVLSLWRVQRITKRRFAFDVDLPVQFEKEGMLRPLLEEPMNDDLVPSHVKDTLVSCHQ